MLSNVAERVKENGNANRDSFQSALSGEAAKLYGDGIGFSPFFLNMLPTNDPIIAWSEYPHQRDRQLAAFARDETIFAGTSYSMRTRIGSLPFTPKGSSRQESLALRLFESADGGKGLPSVIDKMMAAYDTQDNGWFVELVGAGRPDGPMVGRPVTFNFLDPACCYRTFDPQFPVFYRDPLTFAFHKLHKDRVVFGSSMPSISATARGVGQSTLTRALRAARIMRDIAIYKDEKISGRFTRGIGYGKGITNSQLGATLGATKESADALGLTIYNGIPFFVTVNGVELGVLDLASIPDGFDTEKDTTIYVYALALAFGTDAREIWPATAAGATKADASVQHMKAQGKGVADRIRQVEWMLTSGPLRGLNIEVEADFTDDEQDQRRAELGRIRTETFNSLLKNGVLSKRQVQALVVSEGIVDAEVLQNVEDVLEGIELEEPEVTAAPPPGTAPEPPQPEPTAEAEPVEEGEKASKKKDLRTPYAGYYEQQVNQFQRELESLLQETVDDIGKLDVLTFMEAAQLVDILSDKFYALVGEGITRGFGVGLAGDKPSEIGLITMQTLYDKQAPYIDRFISDFQTELLNGMGQDWTGEDYVPALSPYVSRAGLYAGSMWESTWFGLGDMLGREAKPRKVRRLLDDLSHHCRTCPPKSRDYDSFEAMILETGGVPGDGSDECGPNCRCWLEIETEPGSGVYVRWNGPMTSISRSVLRRRS